MINPVRNLNDINMKLSQAAAQNAGAATPLGAEAAQLYGLFAGSGHAAADFSGIVMGWIASTLAEPVSLRFFLNKGLNGVTFNDLLPPIFKTCVFGFIVGLVSCFQGMNTRGGTEGVGRSATSSVLLSSLFVILADVVLVRFIIVFFERG